MYWVRLYNGEPFHARNGIIRTNVDADSPMANVYIAGNISISDPRANNGY